MDLIKLPESILYNIYRSIKTLPYKAFCALSHFLLKKDFISNISAPFIISTLYFILIIITISLGDMCYEQRSIMSIAALIPSEALEIIPPV
jgi:hypothetical protein